MTIKTRKRLSLGLAVLIGSVVLARPLAIAAQEPVVVTAANADTRREQVQLYLDEFADGRFKRSYPQIHTALTNAFNKLPEEVFVGVTDRDRPMIFVLAITGGIARYANSTEFIVRETDPPTFKDGFYLVVLGDELQDAPGPEAIEGIILHETAHRFLEHLRAEEFSCEMERETNRLVKAWGFEKEYQQASAVFGSKMPGDSPCSDAREGSGQEQKEDPLT